MVINFPPVVTTNTIDDQIDKIFEEAFEVFKANASHDEPHTIHELWDVAQAVITALHKFEQKGHNIYAHRDEVYEKNKALGKYRGL